MPPVIPELTWMTLTSVINNMLPNASFLRNIMFPASTEETLMTETIEIGELTADREVAPMVKAHSKSVMVGGIGEKLHAVTTPNIRISRPMEAATAFFRRRAGTSVFPQAGEQISAIQAAVLRDLQHMRNMIDNRIELMVSQAIQGQIVYSVEDQESIQITFPKPAGHTVTLAGADLWDDAASQPHEHFLEAQQLINDATGMNVAAVVMSASAAYAFLKNANALKYLDNRRVEFGNLNIGTINNGAVPLGTFQGVPIWMYNRSLTVDGVSTPLIRDKYVEFLANGPAAENRLYYGAIADWQAFEEGSIAVKIFSKSWMTEDPSSLMNLVHTRPLPVPRRPASIVSMKVLA